MHPRVVNVSPLPDYKLALTFANQEHRVFDVRPYLNVGVFRQLRDEQLFRQVKPFSGTVVWPNDVDFDPDTLYLDAT